MEDGNKAVVAWVSCHEGKTEPGAVVAGKEKHNRRTYFARVSLDDRRFFGRVVPSSNCCLIPWCGMEHRRYKYEVLVDTSPDTDGGLVGLVWRKDYDGHVPDTAVSDRGNANDDTTAVYAARSRVNKNTVLPGYVVPSHGVMHTSFNNRERLEKSYEVLCRDAPCSLKYLAGKVIRDRVKARGKKANAAASWLFSSIDKLVFRFQRVFATLLNKTPPFRERPEVQMDLPNTLADYITSPRSPRFSRKRRASSTATDCCPFDENCPCQMHDYYLF